MSEESDGTALPAEGAKNRNVANPNLGNKRRNNRNRANRIAARVSRFEGKCKALKKYVYDVSLAGTSTDLFTTTTKGIAEYIATEYDDAGEYRTGLVDMKLPTLEPPENVEPDRVLEFELWKLDMRDYRDKSRKRAKNDAKAFALILGQCSRTIRDRIEAASTWTSVNESSNVIGLLRLIRQSMFTGATTRHEAHALIDAKAALHKFKQGERMPNSEYLEKFKGLVEVVEHFGGELGQSPSRIESHTEVIADLSKEEELYVAKEKARESYLAVLLLTKSDPKRYGQLIADLENNHTRGNNDYPTTMSAAYDVLVNYKTVAAPRFYQQDGGMAFYSEADNGYNGGRGRGNDRGGAGRGRGRGFGAGRGRQPGRGGGQYTSFNNVGTGAYTGQNQDEDFGQNHLVQEQENNDSNIDINVYHVYSHSVFKRHLPKNWLLLDSCSSVDLISDPALLKNIHTTNRTMNVHCNAGSVAINQQGMLGSYPRHVWYNEGGIANIMSLFNVSQHYRITMDTEYENCFELHRKDGTRMKFYPCSKGLYKYQLQPNENIQNVWSMVTTVKQNADKYTKRAYKQAMMARKMQKIIMNPGARELMDVSIGHLKDCSITRSDVLAAEDILGPSLGGLKGKTVHRPGIHVSPGIEPVPYEIMKLHRDIILSIDIMYVNKIPFLITTSRKLHFGTVEVLPDRQTMTIVKRLRTVVKLYQHRGFRITSIMSDYEFEPICPYFPTLNCCAIDEHVPEVERYIRTVKDRVRSTYTVLPFRRIPRLMVIHLVKNAVFWLNSFPHRDGISSKHSPRYLMTGKELSYKNHVRMEFGGYAQTHKEHDNSMTDRTVGSICLGPTGNQQGGHFFFNLNTGSRIVRYRWTEMPMPHDVITRVNHFGTVQKMPTTLTFADRNRNEIGDTLDEMLEGFDDADDSSYSSDEEPDDDESLEYDSDDDDDIDAGNNDYNINDIFEYSDEISSSSSEDDASDSSDDSNDSSDNDDDPYDSGDEEQVPDDSSHEDLEDSNNDSEDLNKHSNDPQPLDTNDGDTAKPVEITGVDGNEADKSTGVEVDNAAVDDEEESVDSEVKDDNMHENKETLEETFMRAAEAGARAALDEDTVIRPHRIRKTRRDDAYEYANIMMAVFEDMTPAAIFTILTNENNDQIHSLVTAQMSAKKGLKTFGKSDADAIKKELEQLVYRKVMQGKDANTLTTDDKKAALKYLMFLKQKRCGKIKGRGCADGRKQRIYKTKEETSSPTMSTESLFLTCVIDAMEDRNVITCDIPGAFMQADIDEVVHIKLESELADLLARVKPTYKRYTTYENGKKVIYAELNKALYGTVANLRFLYKCCQRMDDSSKVIQDIIRRCPEIVKTDDNIHAALYQDDGAINPCKKKRKFMKRKPFFNCMYRKSDKCLLTFGPENAFWY